MAIEYSVETIKELTRQFAEVHLHRPLRIERYDEGDELTYQIRTVVPDAEATVRVVVDKFVGGGFAGQVYRVKVLDIQSPEGEIPGLQAGQFYAMKIMIPPSGFSRIFRNAIYGLGFQGAFSLQVNPAAARAGALWQKFIRRAAGIRFGNESCVTDILATFVDENLGSCGELSEWIDGRTWRLEVDDRLDLLRRWRRGEYVGQAEAGSPEYRAKYRFMREFVQLLNEIGAAELARQYEWSTCKSQPNCLKRRQTQDDPQGGLVAVDFRAGLALLLFLPMSPGDFKLIGKGLLRGSLVQFDRGNLGKLQAFIADHPDRFADMGEAFHQLQELEKIYRDSQVDITHHHLRLLYSGGLWSTIFRGAVTGWQVRNIAEPACAEKLRASRLATLIFCLLGLIPLLGSFIRRLWGRSDYRRHYRNILGSWDYFCRAIRGRIAEKIITWHRKGRINAPRALRLAARPGLFWGHLALSILPAGLHRMLTDGKYAREKLHYIFVRPIKLYFNAELREEWLREMVKSGRKNHMVTDEDAEIILSRIKEPFIQKYLKSLAVHVCTLPVTQIVSVSIAAIYYFTHPQDANAWAVGLGIIALFQVTPISPGSLCRGLYVLYLVIRERNFKDYNIAVFLGFFKYVGYLAFPIQMAYRYPVLARFMAGHWATGAVHIVPVFGERGALLEHGIFNLFYNLPLTLRRRMARRAAFRLTLAVRSWHLLPCILAGSAAFVLADLIYLKFTGTLPSLKNIWWLTLGIPLLAGVAVTLAAGGTFLARRIILAAGSGVVIAVIYTAAHLALAGLENTATEQSALVFSLIWKLFLFSLFSTVGAILAELQLPEPPVVKENFAK